KHGAKRKRESIAADDPEHGEAAQRVDRGNTRRGRTLDVRVRANGRNLSLAGMVARLRSRHDRCGVSRFVYRPLAATPKSKDQRHRATAPRQRNPALVYAEKPPNPDR